ncbi:hypothetical protein L211DRAFT_842085 [Terfezia boudieri ATCC MYA-4762]|uniref:Uncharacterized protein n=1 Tax=Terfezia boudieri ATCC MYA-4762 TaxID=1051890 RepID=A0A3N4LHA9_9PEZI|nr:hypothetical protein L211DRAFT_842085 [Terfezia boudieri ATCC MYA-4762]
MDPGAKFSHFIYRVEFVFWEYMGRCLRLHSGFWFGRKTTGKVQELCQKWILNTATGPVGGLLKVRLYAMGIEEKKECSSR